MTKDEWAEKIITRGFHSLAKDFHTDIPGRSTKQFQELTEAASFLRHMKDHAEPARSQMTNGAWQLQLEMEHISALLTGRLVDWNGPTGLRVQLILRGGPGNLVADVLGKLVERYVKPRKR